jgi:glyoxylase-like metal-dependent hydrolase (beta-lactamase superfamily II)
VLRFRAETGRLDWPSVSSSSQAAPGIIAIDTMMAGREVVTSAYLIEAAQPALVETGPTTSVNAVLEALGKLGLGADDLAHIVVTHIHLDHAGGVGRLAGHFPRARVWVHDRGAPHLADPAKLVRSAGRVYGEDRMLELFGPVDPVPGHRLFPLSDGDRVDLDGRTLEVIYTPGHASHHIALVDSTTGALFTGDALGIHLPDVRVLRPATPPPDIDIEMSVDSIRRIHARAGAVLLFSHYGPVEEVDEICELAEARLRKWAGIVREAMDQTSELDRVAEILRARTASEFSQAGHDGADLDRYELLSSVEMNAAGLIRYWTKRSEAAG